MAFSVGEIVTWTGWLVGQIARRSRSVSPREGSWVDFVSDPKNTVLTVLILALVIGGGRRWLQARRARKLVDRLQESDLRPEEVSEAVEHGRAALIELFALLDPRIKAELRDAAGHALTGLWARDQLIVEEEKAIVSRGFTVTWRARRRYPRGLRVPIPIEIAFGVPFVREQGDGIKPSNLEWSYRIVGAERASLEQFSQWAARLDRVAFTLEPDDFAGNGPHRLVFQAKVRTAGLTSSWELELPHVPFTFEFDPILAVDALLTLPDDTRGEQLARAVRLESPEATDGESRYVNLNEELALRDPPELVVTSLPCDLAHRVELEFEGLTGRHAAGELVLGRDRLTNTMRLPLKLDADLSAEEIDRPGERRLRAILTADPHRGWADPDVRSIWPGEIVTDWATVRVIRR